MGCDDKMYYFVKRKLDILQFTVISLHMLHLEMSCLMERTVECLHLLFIPSTVCNIERIYNGPLKNIHSVHPNRDTPMKPYGLVLCTPPLLFQMMQEASLKSKILRKGTHVLKV